MPQSLTDEKLALVQVINGFVPPNNEPLHVPMLTQIYELFSVYIYSNGEMINSLRPSDAYMRR